jgi:multicomponent Na+:H+ antiporter subunit G
MMVLIDILSWASLLAGGFFLVVSSYGILRMPDVYTRVHSASVGETLGVGLLILGMLLQSPHWLVSAKLITIGAVIFFTAPVAGHALTAAALAAGIAPRVTDPKSCIEAVGDDMPVKPERLDIVKD